MIHENSIARKIVEFVKANPGTTRREIIANLPAGTKAGSVSSIMRLLREKNTIENRAPTPPGGTHNVHYPAEWYIVESASDPRYLEIAQSLLEDLATVHHTNRDAYLAKRLEELCSRNTETPN